MKAKPASTDSIGTGRIGVAPINLGNLCARVPDARLARHDAETLALVMLQHGARVGIVHWATGLKSTVLAGWYRQLHGRAPPRGPLPDSAGSMIRTRTEHAAASLFGVVYAEHRRDGAHGRIIDPHGLVRAYELYLALIAGPPAGVLGINQAWIVARDLRAGLAAITWCPSCEAPYIALRDAILIGCPLCALYARAGGRASPRRAGHPDATAR
jgi:hypothetical protein